MCSVNSCLLKLSCHFQTSFLSLIVSCLFLICVYVFQQSSSQSLLPRSFMWLFYRAFTGLLCSLCGCHGNMALCVLFTRASYRNKVPSTICTASALSSTLRGSSINGILSKKCAFVNLKKNKKQLNLSCFQSVGILIQWPEGFKEKEVATSGVEVWQRQEAANGRCQLLAAGSAGVESGFKGPHLPSAASFQDVRVKYVPPIY